MSNIIIYTKKEETHQVIIEDLQRKGFEFCWEMSTSNLRRMVLSVDLRMFKEAVSYILKNRRYYQIEKMVTIIEFGVGE